METNWILLSVIGVLALLLIFYLVNQNRKDEKTFEKEVNLEKPDEESELNNDDGPY